MRPDLSRLRHLELAEVIWRSQAAADRVWHRVGAAVRRPRWSRHTLARALAGGDGLAAVRDHLSSERWLDAHAALARHFHERAPRFVIAPSTRTTITRAVRRRFPDTPRDAALHGDRLIEGRYDLLGYRDVPFNDDWHYDPVHECRAPFLYWSAVPYLDPRCGDHKVIWEVNRHQHWLALGRAYWLTGDARYRSRCLSQLQSWMAANPPRMGINWASMLELALRSLSWLWALHFFVGPAERERDEAAPWLVDLLLGLDRQLGHIERHLSYYFSPNTHLLGEALALYVVSRSLPELAASPRREALGRRILVQEVTRQIAIDGGHCERSAHYHRYTLDFYLLALAVARVTDDRLAALLQKVCARLGHAARVLADDAGRLPHLGDDDGGRLLPFTPRPNDDVGDSLAIAAALTGDTTLAVGDPPEELWWVAGGPTFADAVARLERARPAAPLPSTALPATGYYVSRTSSGDRLVIDGGTHGYLNGGHAHADALALSFTRRGRPLFIDTGTGCYTTDPGVRDWFRSSQMHNTLTLDGRSQSTARGPFHWSHTADASARRWRTADRFDYFVGSQDGYHPLVHWRHVFVLHDDVLVVADLVASGGGRRAGDGASVHHAAVHWHLDPSWRVEAAGRGARLVNDAESLDLLVTEGSLRHLHGDGATGLGWHAPDYGRIEAAHTLQVTREGPLPLWMVTVVGLDPANRVRAVEFAEVLGGSARAHATAIRLSREHSVDDILFAEHADAGRAHPLWRVAGLVTDAHLLFVRRVGEKISSVALADGATVREAASHTVYVAAPTPVSTLYLDAIDAPSRRSGAAPPATRAPQHYEVV